MESQNQKNLEQSLLDNALGHVRGFVRLAPLLAAVLALSACGKKADDPELQACRIETAKIEGILKGVGIDNDQSPTDTIQACLVAKARIEGIMRGAAMRDKEVKVQLDAMGVKLGFDLPGGKAHPGLSEEGDADTVKKVTPATPEEIALKTAEDKLKRAKTEEKTRAVEREIARIKTAEQEAVKAKAEFEREKEIVATYDEIVEVAKQINQLRERRVPSTNTRFRLLTARLIELQTKHTALKQAKPVPVKKAPATKSKLSFEQPDI